MNAPLINAVLCNDVAAVRAMLESGDVNPCACNSLALQCAAAEGLLDIVELLVTDGRVDVHAFCDFSLRWAALGGHVDVLFMLCRANMWLPAVIQGVLVGGPTAIERLLVSQLPVPIYIINRMLYAAAEHGHVALVERVLRRDARAHCQFALAGFACGGFVDAIDRILQDARVDPSANDNCAVALAASKGHHAVVARLLRDERVDANAALVGFARGGYIGAVNRLLADARIDPATDNDEAVRAAASNGHHAVVERLLRDERVAHNAALAGFASGGHVDAVDCLLRDVVRVDPAANDNDVIRLAAGHGHLAVVECCVSRQKVDAALLARIVAGAPDSSADETRWLRLRTAMDSETSSSLFGIARLAPQATSTSTTSAVALHSGVARRLAVKAAANVNKCAAIEEHRHKRRVAAECSEPQWREGVGVRREL
jgi:hypothetical protein